MRFSLAVLVVAWPLLGFACSSASTTSTATDGASPVVEDVVIVNACVSYGPTGSVCRGGGLCGLGFTTQGQYLCASSTEVCCAPVGGANADSGAADATVGDATFHDSGHEAAQDSAHDAAADTSRETGMPDVASVVDAGREATADATQDSGHDAGEEAGHDAAHDSAHDSPGDAAKKASEAGDDAAHHEGGSDGSADDAKPG